MRRFLLVFLSSLAMSCRAHVQPTVWSQPPQVYCLPVEAQRTVLGTERYPNLVCYPGNYIRSLRRHPTVCLTRISAPMSLIRELAEAPEGQELRRRNPNFVYNTLLQYFTFTFCDFGANGVIISTYRGDE